MARTKGTKRAGVRIQKGSIAYKVLGYLAKKGKATKNELKNAIFGYHSVRGWNYLSTVLHRLKNKGLIKYSRGSRLRNRGPKEVTIAEITEKGKKVAKELGIL